MNIYVLTENLSGFESGTILIKDVQDVSVDPLMAGLQIDHIQVKAFWPEDGKGIASVHPKYLKEITEELNFKQILPNDIVVINSKFLTSDDLPTGQCKVLSVDNSGESVGESITIESQNGDPFVINSLLLNILKEVAKRVPQASITINPHALHQELKKKFVKVKKIAYAFAAAYNGKKNIVFYGPGGHGKSLIMNEIWRILEEVFHIIPSTEPVFVQTCGKALTSEKLFGGIKNVEDALQGNYNVEASFMNHKFVVFEELFDSDIEALLDLKDPLTSGYFRNGSQRFKMKTEMVVVLTNRSREELIEDESTNALLERFPMELEVKWENYSSTSFQQMFQKVYNDPAVTLSDLIADEWATGNKISPRTAIHAYESMKINGVNALSFVSGFSEKAVKKAIEMEEYNRKVAEALKVLNDTKKEVDAVKIEIDTVSDPGKVLGITAKIRSIKKVLQGLPQEDAHFQEAADLIGQLSTLAEHAKERAVVLFEDQHGEVDLTTMRAKSSPAVEPPSSSDEDANLPFKI